MVVQAEEGEVEEQVGEDTGAENERGHTDIVLIVVTVPVEVVLPPGLIHLTPVVTRPLETGC